MEFCWNFVEKKKIIVLPALPEQMLITKKTLKK